MPVPVVDIRDYELRIEIDGTDKMKTLKLDDIYALPKENVTATIMCGGNRRSEMTQLKPVKGLSWGMAAVGNAVWTGPKLCDILKEMGIESNETQHVHVSVRRSSSSITIENNNLAISHRNSLRDLTTIQRQRHTLHQYHYPKQWIPVATLFWHMK